MKDEGLALQHFLAAGAASLVLLPAAARAQDAPADADRDTVTIGLGAAVVPTYEGSDNSRLIPAAVARGSVSGFDFTLAGTNLYVDLVREPADAVDFSFGPVVGVNLNRTSRKVGDARVRALGKLDTAVELGGYVGIGKTGVITSAYDTLSFSIAYQRDVAGAHDSYVITPSLSYGTPLSTRTYVGLSLSSEYVGDKYADYYFSISPAAALASGLPAYRARGGFKDASISLLGAQSLSGDLRHGWGLFGIVSYSRLLGDFRDSPTVSVAGSPNQWFGALGVNYTF